MKTHNNIDMTDARVNMNAVEYLNDLMARGTTDNLDELMMTALCRKAGFPNVVVTCGIVYLEGHGTLDAPPAPIHQIGKLFLNA